MSADVIAYLLAGAVAGGFVSGLAGTGTALFALGFYLVVLPPVTAVAIVALMAVLSGLQGIWVVRSEIFTNPIRLLRFVIPGLVGVPIGVSLLEVISAETLRIGIAVLLIVYGGYFSFRAALPALTRSTPWVDSAVGFIGGVLGGSASAAGALPAMWLSMRPWPKAETRAVLQPYNVLILSTTITLLFLKGSVDSTITKPLFVTIPSGIIATQIGIYVFRRLSDDMFRRVLIIMTLLMGLGILASEVL